jgi:protein involved in polysaccharide export with SLBB domain
MRQLPFIVTGVIFLFFLIPPSLGQYPEEKKAESEKSTNPFLRSDSYEEIDLLEKYYQQIFSEQAKPTSFRSDFAGDPSKLLEQSKSVLGLEGPINPEEYDVGPLDVLTIYILGTAPFRYTGAVTPEGTLIIPTIGEIAVAGEKLSKARVKIQEAVRKKYVTGEITVTLESLRTFKVTVAGAVTSPGTYTATPIDRVDRVVYLANISGTTSQPASTNENLREPSLSHPVEEKPATSISLRNIKIFRATGDTVDVDLIRYYATGDKRFNPYLRDKDVIWVPAENLLGNKVSIYGGVRMPGQFEFHEGDSLRAILRIAQGPTALADLENVEVARFLPDGKQVQIVHINLQSAGNGQVLDIALQHNDRIFIRERLDLRQEQTVFVHGAVRWPGAYALTQESYKLSQIIERAGGFAPEASIAESKVIRRYKNVDASLNNPEYARLFDVRLMDLNREGREYFNYETAIKRGFVAVDFAKLFNHHEKSADVVLLDGDEIYVPSLHMNVYVFGQVFNPGYVAYLEGMDYRYYLEKTGGFSKEADRDEVRVLKRGTKAWAKPGQVKIEPGDQIFVPRAVRRSFAYYFNITRDVLQTTAGIATVVLLIVQLQK